MPIEVRREQVLDAALRLICEHGYAAANMEALARPVRLVDHGLGHPDLARAAAALIARARGGTPAGVAGGARIES